MSKP
jgi:hypothetical protein